MSGEMVRATLKEKEEKTQTRRTRGLEKINSCPDDWELVAVFQDGLARFYNHVTGKELTIKCPYGGYGDRLWVKETFQTFRKDTAEEANNKFIAGQNLKSVNDLIEWGHMPSGHGELGVLYAADFGSWAYDIDSDLSPWRPSIFMPRWASRILLEITNIRIQRIQGITDEEAMAEGCPSERALDTDGKTILYSGYKPTFWFSELWDSIYAKRGHGWEKNDWVWVIEFKRVVTDITNPTPDGGNL
ncbi:hypothetical protein VLL09_04500 [Dehalococcoides mccartyi]|uniref:Morphogenetic protein n=1 Tax=Dehalococcoides mccartyi TaxID=61435 RepID=A0AB38Z7V2_9CHLR|nr:hypothetical protein [Dehalococcoides mccartyi]WRO06655.1 hypothetical protein VLL09_04500 [Dehalococcoides mccartyi]